jgi:hypothetical protein
MGGAAQVAPKAAGLPRFEAAQQRGRAWAMPYGGTWELVEEEGCCSQEARCLVLLQRSPPSAARRCARRKNLQAARSGLAKDQQGWVALLQKGLDCLGVSQKEFQDCRGACVADHQPDQLGRSTAEQAETPEIIIFAQDRVAMLTGERPDR